MHLTLTHIKQKFTSILVVSPHPPPNVCIHSATHPHLMFTLLLVMFAAAEAFLTSSLPQAHECCPPDKQVCPYLQMLLGKLGAMLRSEGSQEEGRAGGQHGRIWAWM